MRLKIPIRAGLFWLAATVSSSAAPSCAAATIEPVRVASVSDRLDLVLADGRLAYFPSLEPPRASAAAPQRPRETAAELASLLQNRALNLAALGPSDRWGRIPVRLFPEGESESADETLAAAGLAMASADPGPCGAGVLAAEAQARAAKLGLWADPAFAALDPDDRAAFIPRAGTLAVVEGRVRSIGHAGSRSYLNLGAGRGGVAIFVAKRNQPAFDRAGFDARSLANRPVRIRGVIEIGAAPQIELFHPGQIEFMDGTPPAGGAQKPESPGRP
jgi:micrococcal nuclease